MSSNLKGGDRQTLCKNLIRPTPTMFTSAIDMGQQLEKKRPNISSAKEEALISQTRVLQVLPEPHTNP